MDVDERRGDDPDPDEGGSSQDKRSRLGELKSRIENLEFLIKRTRDGGD